MRARYRVFFWAWSRVVLLGIVALCGDAAAQEAAGYYRFPAIHGDTIVFTAEGDLWKVAAQGGHAHRLTAHPGEETHATISRDGKTIAFTGTYEGPSEIYTLPWGGGLPQRWTYDGSPSLANTWSPDGYLVFATTAHSTLPDYQLVSLDIGKGVERRIPLSQASEASYSDDGRTVFFVRPADHRNVTKRYTGGTARQVWSWTAGEDEAKRLTEGYAGECHHPMYWDGRVYFVTDRSGSMNLWSVNPEGKDWRQHTRHQAFDVRSPSIGQGRIVYQHAADIRLYDIRTGEDRLVSIALVSDFAERQEKWVDDPLDYVTRARLSPDGKRVLFTARGRLFVVPVGDGRLTPLFPEPGIRFRDASWMPSGERVLALTDQSGEFEFVSLSPEGGEEPRPLTDNGSVLRFEGKVSPDGKWVAFSDLDNSLWLLKLATGEMRAVVDKGRSLSDLAWAPDSRWLAFVEQAANTFSQIWIYDVEREERVPVTTDRLNSVDPVWGSKGERLFFLSDRSFRSLVGSPWGTRQPEPYFDKKMKLYELELRPGLRSPFRPWDELADRGENKDSEKVAAKDSVEKGKDVTSPVEVEIDFDGIQQRIVALPVPAGNYFSLRGNDKALFALARETGLGGKTHLKGLKIANEGAKWVTVLEDVSSFDLSAEGTKLLIRKGRNYYVTDARAVKASDLDKGRVDLANWGFSLNTQEDWRQIYTDAWRMERDYFYDPGMHGVDWDAIHDKYFALVDRITTRAELSDLIGRMVGELSALHTSVRGGDLREGPVDIGVASLGARFVRDVARGGFRVDRIYRADPDFPEERAPLDQPGLGVEVGDVLTHVNGQSLRDRSHPNQLLRDQARAQVRLRFVSDRYEGSRDVIVRPMSDDGTLRYRDWELSRRERVESAGKGRIGYVHLRAMGSSDLSQWYREFYPVFDRAGLIIDVRHNRGGNIDSFILEKLSRRAWMYWKSRDREPTWNMQYAFRGHMVVLIDERTASDGEAFAEGFRRLGLGPLIGTRTWGGEIWLNSANRLSDNGLARAPMMGVYGPEGEWLIEQHGVEPDVVIDNLPHATFNGKDAQLEAALAYLQGRIAEDPREVPAPPPFPDRSGKPVLP